MSATEDPLTAVHKGLRSMLYSLSGRVQTNDFGDVATTSKIVHDMEADFETAQSTGCALCIAAHHAEDEDRFVFPEAARHANALVTSLIAEHQELTRRERAVAQRARNIVQLSSPQQRVVAGAALNLDLNELVGAYLAHMNREERELVPLMQERFSDEELRGMRGRIIANMAPPRLFAILNWMLPAMNVTELSDLLRGVRPTARPALYQQFMELCAARVEPARWAQVQHRVGAG